MNEEEFKLETVDDLIKNIELIPEEKLKKEKLKKLEKDYERSKKNIENKPKEEFVKEKKEIFNNTSSFNGYEEHTNLKDLYLRYSSFNYDNSGGPARVLSTDQYAIAVQDKPLPRRTIISLIIKDVGLIKLREIPRHACGRYIHLKELEFSLDEKKENIILNYELKNEYIEKTKKFSAKLNIKKFNLENSAFLDYIIENEINNV